MGTANSRSFGPWALPAAVIAFLAVAPALAQVSNPQARITAAVDDADRTTLRGNTHPLARPAFDRGTAPDDLPMNRMLLALKRSPEQDAALQTFLDAQQDRSSPAYQRWLTPDQIAQQFGPNDQDV